MLLPALASTLPRFNLGVLLLISLFLSSAVAQTKKPGPLSTHKAPSSELLNKWWSLGLCAGNHGIYYDNRDMGHSDMPLQQYPGIQRVPYTDEMKQAKANVGLANRVLAELVIGNCSMASSVTDFGSLARMYYGDPQGQQFLYTQYFSNNIYVYPEHQDHDPGVNGSPGYGDVFPTNTPYTIITQGSSFSDRPFLHALFKTTAAFKPEVRSRLLQRRIFCPTLQQILRSTYGPEDAPFDYLSGKAHPTVFDKNHLSELRMVRAAQAITEDAIPPLVQLAVVKEDKFTPGIDYFEPENLQTEVLGDTRSVISRIYRSRASQRRITVSARQSNDINNRPLTYEWRVLRGDPQRVRIVPSKDGGSAEITVAYHSRSPIEPGSSMQSNRVDIGVFAHNGVAYSAPGFVTFYTLANEDRIYSNDHRLLEIYYAGRSRSYTLAPVTPDAWVPLLQAYQVDAHPDLSPLLRETLPAPEMAELDAAFSGVVENFATMRALREQANERISGFEAREREAKANLAKITAAAKKGEAPASQIANAKEISDLAEGARKAVQPEVDTLRRQADELSGKVVERLLVKGPSQSTPKQLVKKSVDTVLGDPSYYLKRREALDRLGRESGRDGGAVNRGLTDLVSLQVLLRQDKGFRLPHPGGLIPTNDSHHLSQFNLLVAQKLLFPGIIRRPSERNFVDARLTAPKLWRDVYQYGRDGKIAGWVRIQGGKAIHFDARGNMLQGGPAGAPTAVEYRIDPRNKTLAGFPK